MSVDACDQIAEIAARYPLIIVPCGKKGPRKHGWQNQRASQSEVVAAIEAGKNVGLLLGPVSGVIDIEVDGPEGYESLRKLFDGEMPPTPSWASLRGKHFLFSYEVDFDGLTAFFSLPDYPGLEFRIGTSAAQSLIPPSQVEGFTREWEVSLADCAPSKLPEAVVRKIVAGNRDVTGGRTADSCFNELDLFGTKLRDAKVAKLVAYFKKHAIAHSVEATDTATVIRFAYCPLRGPAHMDGGAIVYVNPDGSHAFNCKHRKCSGMTFADIEKKFGQLVPVILVGPDSDRVVKQAIEALAENAGVFQRGVLTQVVHDAGRPPLCLHDNGSPRLRQIPVASLGPILSGCAVWKKWSSWADKYVRCVPPADIVRAVDAAGSFPGVPVITGISSCPVLRADGSLLSTSGYDAATGLFLDLSGEYPPLMDPEEAIALLYDVVHDFPFVDDSHRSAWLASLITLVARPAFGGNAPMFVFDANASRTGKGLLTDVLTMILEGRKAARHSAPRNDEEFRKVITSVALSGVPYVLLDNVKEKLGGEAIENAMTAGRWQDRLLGGNKTIDLPLNLVWMATANNATVTQDMVGRVCQCRLETRLENPALRSDFRHQHLLRYVKDNRQKLAMAALSIPAAYIRAGGPEQNLPAWGGFEDWSNLVRGSLVWAGQRDPGETRLALAAQSDDETSQLRRLMEGWRELKFPATVSVALECIQSDPEKFSTLRDVVGEIKGDPRNGLGQLLKKHRRRIVNGRYFDRTDHDSPRWFLVEV